MAAPMSLKLKRISSVKHEEGRELLREELGWEPFDDDDEPQKSIQLDCLFDNLMFMVKKGFHWNEIAVLFNLVKEILESSKDQSIHEAVKAFSKKLQSVSYHLSEPTAKQFSEFFFITYMRHFKLYQYVYNNSREELLINTEVMVGTPPVPVPPFTDAKDLDVYDYETKYKQLEEQEDKLQQKHQQHLDELQKKTGEDVKTCIESVGDSSLDREELIRLIHEVAGAHITAASAIISTQITNTMEDLDIKLEKTSLPRPHALGQPPRYKTKTPIPSSPIKRQLASRETVQTTNSKSRQSSRHGKR